MNSTFELQGNQYRVMFMHLKVKVPKNPSEFFKFVRTHDLVGVSNFQQLFEALLVKHGFNQNEIYSLFEITDSPTTTVCLLFDRNDVQNQNVISYGISFTNERAGDRYDRKVGRNISMSRMIKNLPDSMRNLKVDMIRAIDPDRTLKNVPPKAVSASFFAPQS